MTAVSSTIAITNTNYEKLATLANITMTNGKSYSIQIQGLIGYRVANADFVFNDVNFTFTQGVDEVYVKAIGVRPTIVVLENA